MATSKGRTGAQGEAIACKFLERKGFTIIECNYRKPWGEIDIIAVKSEVVRFVEVKTVTKSIEHNGSRERGSREIDYRPEEMVTDAKLHKVARTAALYMESHNDSREYQVDVVGVIMDPERRIARCRFFEQVRGN